MAKKRFDMEMLESVGAGAPLQQTPKFIDTEKSTTKKKQPGGRPKKEKKADKIFNINFYQDDFDNLEKNASLNGMPVATFVKFLIQKGGGFNPPSSDHL